MTVYGNVWKCVVMYGCVWVCMVIGIGRKGGVVV